MCGSSELLEAAFEGQQSLVQSCQSSCLTPCVVLAVRRILLLYFKCERTSASYFWIPITDIPPYERKGTP